MRKREKRWVSLALASCLAIAALTGCSSGSGKTGETKSAAQAETEAKAEAKKEEDKEEKKEESKDENKGENKEEVTLTFLHHMGEQGKKDGLVALSEAFTKKYPNIKIEVEFLSRDDFINQYKQRVAADNAPDFINYRPFETPEVIEAGLVEPLDPSIFPDNIDKNCIDSISLDGKIYGIPLDRGGYGFYYNKNMLEKAGVKPEDLDTMSGVLEACQKIKDAGMVPLASGYAESWTENIIIEGQTFTGPMVADPMIFEKLMSGEKKFSDYPEFVDIITHGQQLVRDYALVDEKAASQQASDQYAQFGRGDAAMMMQGTWAISDIRIAQKAAGNTDEFGFTYYPWSDDPAKNYMPANADDSFMISSGSKHMEEAMLFAEFVLTPEAGKVWANASGCISALSGVSADNPDPLLTIFTEVLDEKGYYFEMNPGLAGQYYQDFDKIYIEGRIAGDSPETVIEKWQKSFDNIRATGG